MLILEFDKFTTAYAYYVLLKVTKFVNAYDQLLVLGTEIFLLPILIIIL